MASKLTKKPPTSIIPGDDAHRRDAASVTHRCWYFRDADPDFGIQQAKNLQLHLEVLTQREK